MLEHLINLLQLSGRISQNLEKRRRLITGVSAISIYSARHPILAISILYMLVKLILWPIKWVFSKIGHGLKALFKSIFFRSAAKETVIIPAEVWLAQRTSELMASHYSSLSKKEMHRIDHNAEKIAKDAEKLARHELDAYQKWCKENAQKLEANLKEGAMVSLDIIRKFLLKNN